MLEFINLVAEEGLIGGEIVEAVQRREVWRAASGAHKDGSLEPERRRLS